MSGHNEQDALQLIDRELFQYLICQVITDQFMAEGSLIVLFQYLICQVITSRQGCAEHPERQVSIPYMSGHNTESDSRYTSGTRSFNTLYVRS